MKYIITEEDKLLVLQSDLNYKYRLFIIDKNKNILDEVQGISAIGTYSIDADSDIRRTTSFTLLLDNCYRTIMSVEKKLFTWIGYSFQMQIGIYSLRKDDYKWYDCGYYLITEGNTSYNVTDNSLTLNLSDWYAKLNGLRNGQMGSVPLIEIINTDEDGNKITIKHVTEEVLKSKTDFKDYIIEDVGEPYAYSQNNPNYEKYREENPSWNQLPYNLEYDVGSTVGDIFDELKNLYPNHQIYFDIFGIFCFNEIPSCKNDIVMLSNDYIQKILLSDDTENVTYDIESIKNVTEIFGRSYDPDRFSETVTTSNNIYNITLKEYKNYFNGDMIAFTPDSNNTSKMCISINSLDSLPLYKEYTTEYIEENILETNKIYVFQIKLRNGEYVAYYLGQYQPHSLCILSNNEDDPIYTKEYFAKKYNCDLQNVIIRIEEDSPFSVQKLGEILDVKTGEEFDNILSDYIARENALYYNKQSSSVYDTVVISTKMIPFLDVNEKVEYQKQQESVSNYYIIKHIDNELESCTSKITMYRFYPLYYI